MLEINSMVKSVAANNSSGSSHDSLDSECDPPSVVERINLDHLSLLATNSHPEGLPCTVSPLFEAGSFNVVWFLEFSNGDQWVARVPQAPWSPMLERRLRSDMLGYELIARRTSIPIPKIFAFSPGIDNVLGHPFTLVSRAKGVQLSKLWFDRDWFTEEHRQTLFHSLAENMSQLKEITFPKVGSLGLDDDDDGILSVGPILPSWQDLLDQPNVDYDSWVLPGPFVSVHAFLSTIIAQRTACAPTPDDQIELTLLRMFALSLPDLSLDGPPFVLSMPDLNLSNIFITEDGRITCFIDWDGIEAVPIQGGYARYPSWITKDWDPWAYDYPLPSARSMADQPPARPREQLKEDSPSMLQKHREEYLVAYKSVDPTGSHYTRNSHVFEAIRKACTDWIRMGGILRQLSCYAFGTSDNSNFVSWAWILRNLPKGVWSRDYIGAAEKFASNKRCL